jgi:hypothetical protein
MLAHSKKTRAARAAERVLVARVETPCGRRPRPDESMRIRRIAAALPLVMVCLAARAADSAADVQRLQMQRQQQQLELGLKMQQQQERAMRPAPGASADIERRQFERDQLQRQQQYFDEQTRAAIAPAPVGDPAAERARSSQSAVENSRRLETDPRQ